MGQNGLFEAAHAIHLHTMMPNMHPPGSDQRVKKNNACILVFFIKKDEIGQSLAILHCQNSSSKHFISRSIGHQWLTGHVRGCHVFSCVEL